MDDNFDTQKSGTPGDDALSAGILKLFDFYWKKFLSRSEPIEAEEKKFASRILDLEEEVKLKKLREKLNNIS